MQDAASLSRFDLDRAQLQSQGDVWAEVDEARDRYLTWIQEALPLLPPIDRDVLHLHIVEGLTQRQIGPLIGMTQQGVFRRLQSAFRRVQFLVGHPRIGEDVGNLLPSLLDDPKEIAVLTLFAKTAHQSKVARSLRRSQQWTHTLYARGLVRLLQHKSMTGLYLGAWFVLLASQRYLYELPNKRRRSEVSSVGSRKRTRRRA